MNKIRQFYSLENNQDFYIGVVRNEELLGSTKFYALEHVIDAEQYYTEMVVNDDDFEEVPIDADMQDYYHDSIAIILSPKDNFLQ